MINQTTYNCLLNLINSPVSVINSDTNEDFSDVLQACKFGWFKVEDPQGVIYFHASKVNLIENLIII